MRQGRVDLLLYNEPQQMQASAIVNGMFGTADRGGMTILAANPPRLQRGLLKCKTHREGANAQTFAPSR